MCLTLEGKNIKSIKYGRQCGETSTTLAEMQSSVSSVGVQSKGSFIVFLCNINVLVSMQLVFEKR